MHRVCLVSIMHHIAKPPETHTLSLCCKSHVVCKLLIWSSSSHVMQELRVAAQEGDGPVSAMLSAQPDALKRAHKLAYSFADSIVQSTAPLTMRPQQQALCAVCHALCKYGMSHEDAVARYVRSARMSADEAVQADEAALKDALQVQTVPQLYVCFIVSDVALSSVDIQFV